MGPEGICHTTAQIEGDDTKSDTPSVKGNLSSKIVFWEKSIKASKFVLQIIEHGYRLPFISEPPPFYAQNNMSSQRNTEFVERTINLYAKKGYVREISTIPYCCNPLTVAEGKKLRLVLDLRHVNQFLHLDKFRYEDLRVVADLIEQGDYFTKYDLVSGYFHIDIHPDFFKYLGFQWQFR